MKMQQRSGYYALCSSVIAATAALAIAGQAKVVHEDLARKLVNSLKKADVEKLLGKPIASQVREGHLECQYKLKGVERVEVLYYATGGGKPFDSPDDFAFTVNGDMDWRDAVALVGIKSEKLSLSKVMPGEFQVIGESLKNWNVYFSTKGAKYESGELINEGGLPRVLIQSRSINDTSPD